MKTTIRRLLSYWRPPRRPANCCPDCGGGYWLCWWPPEKAPHLEGCPSGAEEKRIESAITDFLFKQPSCQECKGFRETRCYVDREHFKKTGELALSFEPCRTCEGRAMYQVDPVRSNSSIWRQENQERIGKCWEREWAEPDPIKKRTIADERIHCINQARLAFPWEYTDDGSYERWKANGCKPAPVYTREMDDAARL